MVHFPLPCFTIGGYNQSCSEVIALCSAYHFTVEDRWSNFKYHPTCSHMSCRGHSRQPNLLRLQKSESIWKYAQDCLGFDLHLLLNYIYFRWLRYEIHLNSIFIWVPQIIEGIAVSSSNWTLLTAPRHNWGAPPQVGAFCLPLLPKRKEQRIVL